MGEAKKKNHQSNGRSRPASSSKDSSSGAGGGAGGEASPSPLPELVACVSPRGGGGGGGPNSSKQKRLPCVVVSSSSCSSSSAAMSMSMDGRRRPAGLPLHHLPPPPRSASPHRRPRHVRSMFGPQPLSHRASEPSIGFGSAVRVKIDKLYFNSELSKCRVGCDGPGPIYDSKSTLGKQFVSKNESSPNMRFGSAERFSRQRHGLGTPGPGTYNCPSSFGPQVLSCQQSPWVADFSRSTRDQQSKIYLSAEFDKNKYGTQSPGPCVCDFRSSIGPQLTAPNKSAPKATFGGEKRFKYGATSQRNVSPGAGQYKTIGSVGKQTESKKNNCPSFTFGHCDRDHRAKVFISAEHDKAHCGEESPGPGSALKTFTSLGQQSDSRKASCVVPSFGTASRFRCVQDENPGPGEYEC